MEIRQGKNKLLIPLTVVTIVIWGIIIYNIAEYYNSIDDSTSRIIESTDDLDETDFQKQISYSTPDVEYIQLVRDPFVFGKKHNAVQQINNTPVTTKKEKVISVATVTPAINYTISGTLINDASKLAILEDMTNRKTVFMREGDSYLSIVIKEINRAKVVVLEKDVEKEISIKN